MLELENTKEGFTFELHIFRQADQEEVSNEPKSERGIDKMADDADTIFERELTQKFIDQHKDRELSPDTSQLADSAANESEGSIKSKSQKKKSKKDKKDGKEKKKKRSKTVSKSA